MARLDFIGPNTTYYAFPVSRALSLWTTYRVQLLEAVASSKLFSGTVDESEGDWLVFEGAAQPPSYLARKATWSPPVTAANATGAFTRTFNIRQITTNTALEGAKIRVTKGAESYLLITNSSGVAVAGMDAGTWSVAISLFGYTFTPTTLVVSATGSVTYDLTPVSITPSSVSQTTGYWTVYNLSGVIQPNAQVELRTANAPTSSTGLVLEDSVRTATADSNGLVQFTNLFPGVSYIANRAGSTRQYTITVPANAGASVALGSIVG